MKRNILLIGLLFSLLLLGCLEPENGTQDTGPETQKLTAQYGDTVSVDYTLRVDGAVMDTSSVEVAKAAGMYNANKSYSPFTFQMLLGGNVINGFVNGILGMGVGESKNFTVSPADGYGLADQSMITNMSRYYNMSVFEEIPRSYFEGTNTSLENGTIMSTEIGYVGIENVTNTTVTIRYLFYPEHKFAMHGLPQTVVNVTNDTMLVRFDLEENHSYIVTDPYTKEQSIGRVTYADNDTIVMDQNPPLAGKELDFEVTVRSIVKPASGQ